MTYGLPNDVDDTAAAQAPHMRQDRTYHAEESEHLVLELSSKLIIRHVVDSRANVGARVVDQYIGWPKLIDYRRDESLTLLGLCRIGNDANSFGTGLTQPLNRGFESFRIARANSDGRAFCSEALRRREANAPRRASDDGRFTGEPQIHCTRPLYQSPFNRPPSKFSDTPVM